MKKIAGLSLAASVVSSVQIESKTGQGVPKEEWVGVKCYTSDKFNRDGDMGDKMPSWMGLKMSKWVDFLFYFYAYGTYSKPPGVKILNNHGEMKTIYLKNSENPPKILVCPVSDSPLPASELYLTDHVPVVQLKYGSTTINYPAFKDRVYVLPDDMKYFDAVLTYMSFPI